ncbi:glycoside hydrolase [Lojkania enalia]|uniref:Probable beta-glucosidase btgE n=1 Tax=Lojkania enalia TaxID=147567 RepID=A0A9P4MWH4_9PLEO|nr:glycoside hydrolase [Didymosphaeria enalia]
MKGAVAAALIGSVAASHNAHVGFHARRGDYPMSVPAYEVCEVATVYETVYVHPSEIPAPVANSTIYVYPSPVPATSTSSYSTIELPANTSTPCTEVETPTPTPEAYTPVPTTSEKPYVPLPPPVSSYEAPPPPPVYTPVPVPSSSKAAPKPKPSKPADTSYEYSHSGRIVTKGNKWAITYTPYTKEGECKSAEEVKGDIKKISDMGFTTIRSYSTDCGVFENVVPECQKYGLKVIYGIFLEAGGSYGKGPFSPYAENQLNEIKDNAPKDSVAMVIVGNEAIFNGYCTADELASYIDHVREVLQGAGFPKDIAITTTEPVDIWEQYGKPLCAHIDIFTTQVHPFFTAKISAEEAGDFAKEQLEQAAAVCPEAAAKGKYITEIGWPKQGSANGNAVPGYDEQKTAIKKIMEKVGKESCLFSYQDDLWKAPGAFGVEQSFGCADAVY